MSSSLCEQKSICPHYDVIVVGAGIAGLYSAIEVLKKHPDWTVALAERYKGLGGRTYSYFPPGFEGVHWEMGAGRVRKDHRMVLGLLKKYGLHWMPIGSDLSYQTKPGARLEKNIFEQTIAPLFLEPLRGLGNKDLATYTIEELMIQVYGAVKTKELLSWFPYRSEVDTMRADMALAGFLGGGEMASHEGYGVVAEGFGELVRRMRLDFEERGGIVLERHRLTDFRSVRGKTTDLDWGSRLRGKSESATDLDFQFGYGDPGSSSQITLRAEKAVILALHKDAVAELPPFQSWKVLEHLKTQPLLRCYAVFPTKEGKSWFSDLSRIVTPGLPRYILPIDQTKGVIMISYTDGKDTAKYMKIQDEGGDEALCQEVMKDVRALRLGIQIPDPIFFRSHPWKTGTTYWLPGKYNPLSESKEAIHPLSKKYPGVWLCGESWSMRQAWVEGALEHAAEMLKKI
jgi:hypothetical protein